MALRQLQWMTTRLVRGDVRLMVGAWQENMREDALRRHQEVLEAQMQAEGRRSSSAMRRIKHAMMRIAQGEMRVRIEAWRMAARDEARDLQMRRELEGRAGAIGQQMALRQLQWMTTRLVRGDVRLMVGAWQENMREDALRRHQEVQEANLERSTQENKQLSEQQAKVEHLLNAKERLHAEKEYLRTQLLEVEDRAESVLQCGLRMVIHRVMQHSGRLLWNWAVRAMLRDWHRVATFDLKEGIQEAQCLMLRCARRWLLRRRAAQMQALRAAVNLPAPQSSWSDCSIVELCEHLQQYEVSYCELLQHVVQGYLQPIKVWLGRRYQSQQTRS